MRRKHQHHFKVASPNGPTSKGKCRCGETREFFNTYDAFIKKRSWNSMGSRMTAADKAREDAKAAMRGKLKVKKLVG